MRKALAFISDLLYDLNITERPCLVGWRIYLYSPTTNRVYAYSSFFTWSDPSLCVTGKLFRGEEPIMWRCRKYEAEQYYQAYMRMYGDKNKEQA